MSSKNLIIFFLVAGLIVLVGQPSLSKFFSKQRIKANKSAIESVNELSYKQAEVWEIDLPRENFSRANILLLDPETLEDLEKQAAVADLIRTKANFSKLKETKAGKRLPLRKNKSKYSFVLINAKGEVFGFRDKKRTKLVGFLPKYYDKPEIFRVPHNLTVSATVEGNKLIVKKLNNHRAQVLVKINDRKKSVGHLINLLAVNNNVEIDPEGVKILPVQEESNSNDTNNDAETDNQAEVVETPNSSSKIGNTSDQVTTLPSEQILPDNPSTAEDETTEVMPEHSEEEHVNHEQQLSGCAVHEDQSDCDCSIPGCSFSPCTTGCKVGDYDENGNIIESCCGNGTVEEQWELQGEDYVNIGEQCDDNSENCVNCRLRCDIGIEDITFTRNEFNNSFEPKFDSDEIDKANIQEHDNLKLNVVLDKKGTRGTIQSIAVSYSAVAADNKTIRSILGPNVDYRVKNISGGLVELSNIRFFGSGENLKDIDLCPDNPNYYSANFTVKYDNGCSASVPLRINVYDVEMDEVPHCDPIFYPADLEFRQTSQRKINFLTYEVCGEQYSPSGKVIILTPKVNVSDDFKNQYRELAIKEEENHCLQLSAQKDFSQGGYKQNGITAYDYEAFKNYYNIEPTCARGFSYEQAERAAIRTSLIRNKSYYKKYLKKLIRFAHSSLYWLEYTVKRDIGLNWQKAMFHYYCAYHVHDPLKYPDPDSIRQPAFIWDN